MRHIGRENIVVAAPDGSSYLGTLNVYHGIHCFKLIKQLRYLYYYLSDLNKYDYENLLHNENRINFLRQSAMCHGNIGLITFEWHEKSRIPVTNAMTHQYVR
ncbi:hypothetical protein CGRA01v4_02021 [Colletotrichum graminicola]|uniref:Uncharacterized protein n=1 Tax=Colletotrichum graminicola (strain M1.001 / M2 / FGSC 10212) TaxID=645133 RepID=E3QS42_COLGM|nr:uncharacterized protein GLRG_08609 [Colletotrichum graminicola M1.001]EFQ33680.1 hypothetical protein GLRG_08609 [Colletotrichum graminicola M1.001]WDK10742.1 hypothetical protein CGRA01v4_02021 [Colletotrichum graminicola]